MFYINRNYSPKIACEYIINDNIEGINTKFVIYISIVLSIVLYFASVVLNIIPLIVSDNIILNYIIPTVSIMFLWFVISSVIMYIFLKKVTTYIYYNIKIILPNVDLSKLEKCYKEAQNNNIKDSELLKYLQSNT